MPVNLLEVKNLSIRFKQNNAYIDAVKDLSFKLKEGEILGIVGESGSGKSVTAMSIVKLLPSNALYSHGSIQYSESEKSSVNLTVISEEELRPFRGAKISIIFGH